MLGGEAVNEQVKNTVARNASSRGAVDRRWRRVDLSHIGSDGTRDVSIVTYGGLARRYRIVDKLLRLAMIACSVAVGAQDLSTDIQADQLREEAAYYVSKGQYDSAVGAMETLGALEEYERSEDFYFKYGMVLHLAGKFARTKDSLQQYLELSGTIGRYYRDALRLLVEAMIEERRLVRSARTGNVEEEYAAYMSALFLDTRESYSEYLIRYPDGQYVIDAQRRQSAIDKREDDDAYNRAVALDTIFSYSKYLTDYPDGRHVAQVREARSEAKVNVAKALDDEAYARAREQGTVESYGKYLTDHPNGRHATQAREARSEAKAKAEKALDDEAYARAREQGTVESYGKYLTDHPNGRHVAQAREARSEAKAKAEKALDDEAYARAREQGTVESYDRYLADHPDGRHAAQARQVRSEARAKAEADLDDEAYARAREHDTVGSYDKYLSSYPDGRYVAQARNRRYTLVAEDDAAFERAVATGTVGAYDRYLMDHNDGRHVVEAKYMRPGRIFHDCKDCPEMIVIPKGSYLMGSPVSEDERYENEGPQHFVTISQQLAVGRYEVTVGEFTEFVRASQHRTDGSCWAYAKELDNGGKEARIMVEYIMNWSNPGYRPMTRDPVVCVSWSDAQAYVQWLSRHTLVEYRLLTESEWEYIAAAVNRESDILNKHANFRTTDRQECPCDEEDYEGVVEDGVRLERKVKEVGSFRPNRFGLYDVIGNVWEWTEDCWNESYVGAPIDGSAWREGDCSNRVLRGGSWSDDMTDVRTAVRGRNDLNLRADFNGFRVARVLHLEDAI